MKVLIVGNGGREHALAWKAAQSPLVSKVYVAPGNAGTSLEPHVQNIAIKATDIPELIKFAKQHSIDLTMVGPEMPLAAGIVDAFQLQNLACFGPTQAAAQLESSKAFSKAFMQRHHIPTAAHATFDNIAAAKNYLSTQTYPIVIKADGLAAGKGVVIAHNESDAVNAIEDMLQSQIFGSAGNRIIIEEFLTGEEASFIVMCDGETVLPLATSQDHKTRDIGDVGPNTGGMGAYSPAPVITKELHQQIMEQIIYPTIHAMNAVGITYTGFLYAGLMITPNQQAKVLEFNCRLGDPETEPLMMRLKSDLVELCLAATNKRLHHCKIVWDPRPAVGVVLAAAGYPFQYSQGDIINGLPANDSVDCKIFHAGTAWQDDHIVTAGGRVLCVTALGKNFHDAQTKVYAQVNKIDWINKYYRSDIGYRALQREKINEYGNS